jgi:hypothetical protein
MLNYNEGFKTRRIPAMIVGEWVVKHGRNPRQTIEDLPHFLVEPVDAPPGYEPRVVVVDPMVDQPTLLIRPGMPKPGQRDLSALVVPELSPTGLPEWAAAVICETNTDQFRLYQWPAQHRAQRPGEIPLVETHCEWLNTTPDHNQPEPYVVADPPAVPAELVTVNWQYMLPLFEAVAV